MPNGRISICTDSLLNPSHFQCHTFCLHSNRKFGLSTQMTFINSIVFLSDWLTVSWKTIRQNNRSIFKRIFFHQKVKTIQLKPIRKWPWYSFENAEREKKKNIGLEMFQKNNRKTMEFLLNLTWRNIYKVSYNSIRHKPCWTASNGCLEWNKRLQ